MPADDEQDPSVLEAIKWFVRLRDDKATDKDRRAFEEWLDQSPSHREAWERAKQLWDRFDLAGTALAQRRRRPHSRRTVLVGAGIAALAAAGASYWLAHPELGADFRTGLAERRSLTLPDGTRVELGSRSALSIRFDDTFRRVLLLSGEAFFDTASYPKRPFVVDVGGGSVQALGTRFDVKDTGGTVVVAVTEKAVLVRPSSAPPVRVEQGFQVDYGEHGIGAVTRADPDVVEAWRKDRLIFQDMPLAQVLTELARYRRGRVFLVDRELGEIPVTGVFDTRQADAALETIAHALPIRLLRVTNYVVLIYAAR